MHSGQPSGYARIPSRPNNQPTKLTNHQHSGRRPRRDALKKPKGNSGKSGLKRQQNSFGKFHLEYNQGAFADIDDDQMNEQPLIPVLAWITTT